MTLAPHLRGKGVEPIPILPHMVEEATSVLTELLQRWPNCFGVLTT